MSVRVQNSLAILSVAFVQNHVLKEIIASY